MQLGSHHVTVGVRIRPKLDDPTNVLYASECYEPMACFCVSDTSLCVFKEQTARDNQKLFFVYDKVLDENSTQEEVFEELALPAVMDVLRGTSATILAYGQTGSGKTYTVLGGVSQHFLSKKVIARDAGILLRALQEMLHYGEVNRDKIHLVLGFSAVELYLDELRDLLSDEKTPAVIQVNFAEGTVPFSGVTCIPICSLDDGLKAFQRVTARRAQRVTLANDISSCSHAIFTIEVFQQHTPLETTVLVDLAKCISMRDALQLVRMEGGTVGPRLLPSFFGPSHVLLGTADAPVLYSKLLLVDLAGSKNLRNFKVKCEGFEEHKKVNASLTVLGNVIHNLRKGSRHIPCRDSKLTSLLHESFATPNSRVVLIVNVSPTLITVDETLSSLCFPHKIKTLRSSLCSCELGGEDIFRGYFLSLRKFDELMADVRLAGLLYEISIPQVVLFLVNDINNVIYDTLFHVKKPNSEISQMAFSIMCEAFKNNAEEANLSFMRKQELEIEMMKNAFCKKFLTKWKNKRDSAILNIENFLAAPPQNDFTNELKEEQYTCLNEAFAHFKETRDARREVKQRHRLLAASLADAEELMRSIDSEIQSAENTFADDEIAALNLKNESEAAVFRQQDEFWVRGIEQATRALALANMRFDLCLLMRENQQLATLLKGHKQQAGTPTTPEQTIYNWLRSAVWAIAGNAVVISVRRKKQRCLEKAAVSNRSRGSGAQALLQMCQVWQLQPSERRQRNGKRRRHLYSRYDHPALLDDIMSFLRMGGKVMKRSSSGSLRQWLLYVEGKAGHERLCWSTPKSTGSAGCVPLHAVAQILLGRGHGSAEQGAVCLGWALALEGRHPARVLDFVCETVAEMEAWVIGLGNITGKKPVFGEQLKLPLETRNRWDVLSASDVIFCANWHIPPAVYTEARQQLLSRFFARSGRPCRLSPGQLRNLVKLDIFRASAMWLRFNAQGLVVQPGEKLYCYVNLCDALQVEQYSPAIAESSVFSLVENYSNNWKGQKTKKKGKRKGKKKKKETHRNETICLNKNNRSTTI